MNPIVGFLNIELKTLDELNQLRFQQLIALSILQNEKPQEGEKNERTNTKKQYQNLCSTLLEEAGHRFCWYLVKTDRNSETPETK